MRGIGSMVLSLGFFRIMITEQRMPNFETNHMTLRYSILILYRRSEVSAIRDRLAKIYWPSLAPVSDRRMLVRIA